MSGYVDHAWRHLPKAQGGTDPLKIAAGGAPSYAYLFTYGTPQSVGAGGSHRITWDDQFNTNALDTVFSTGGVTTPHNNTIGDLYLHFHAAGYYQIYADVYWANAVYERYFFTDTTCVIFNQNELTAGSFFKTGVTGGSDPLQDRLTHAFVDQYTLDLGTYNFRASVVTFNKDVSSRNVRYATLAAVYWPMANDFQNAPDTDLVFTS